MNPSPYEVFLTVTRVTENGTSFEIPWLSYLLWIMTITPAERNEMYVTSDHLSALRTSNFRRAP